MTMKHDNNQQTDCRQRHKGDHLFVPNVGYSHHGIDCGDGMVVHFDYQPWQKVTAGVSEQPPEIREVPFEEFAKGRPVLVREYPVCDVADVVVERARGRVGTSEYDLFQNNCEHFAVWCKTGRAESTQVEDFVKAARPLAQALPAAAFVARTARRLPGRLRLIGYGAAAAMTAGAFALRYLENRRERSERGES